MKTIKKPKRKNLPGKKDPSLPEKFEAILNDIVENNKSVSDAIKGVMTFTTFYDFLKDEDNAKKYARCCEIRCERINDDILKISDAAYSDVMIDPETGKECINHNVINRNRLQVDARKWALSKMNPKKYGDKLQLDNNITANKEAIKTLFPDESEIKDIQSEK